ncbi:hypothetical protein GCM10010967_47410 [Dyadobacter beijingensis]|uniref:aminodeoxychorismate synthase n=1 Tax=Dyadobacter beijingensis TaxID=365489 RepID=A0ABQ2IHA2_9BACT|nr:aminodeoxychorismate synthase component I [Dyadobacter beijingensis]GGN06655.1 hypothetical protein GCM10010967_47410 [Dyadobacter beijingensis]
MKTLLIDNYDSYSHILADYIWRCSDAKPIVVKNDSLSLEEIKYLEFDNIVISPGPGHPDKQEDFGVCRELMNYFSDVPILGVCLGHQGMGSVFGLKVKHAPSVMHGKYSDVLLAENELFNGMKQAIKVVRYHSLILEDDVSNSCVEVIARVRETGDIMGIKIKDRPYYGVQFHPESVGTEDGLKIISNFIEICKQTGNAIRRDKEGKDNMFVFTEIATKLDCEQIFTRLYKDLKYAFWLDSSQLGLNGSYSILGTSDYIIECDKDNNTVVHRDPASGEFQRAVSFGEDPFDLLNRNLQKSVNVPADFPFSFVGGLLGFFSYEAKRWTSYGESSFPKGERSRDIVFMRVEEFLLVDHVTGRTFACSIECGSGQHAGYASAIQEVLQEAQISFEKYKVLAKSGRGNLVDPEEVEVRMKFSQQEYKHKIEQVFEELRNGESYEVCLTNYFEANVSVDPYMLYRVLRLVNPAPFSAYLRFGSDAILSSSPERFISLDASRRIVCEPIKGTRKRGSTTWENELIKEELLSSEKDHAELLMITDLIRNDLAKVSKRGSVEVTKLVRATEYATVIQLSSVIQSEFCENRSIIDLFKNVFPGGSITGAPKMRTCEIIDRLEERERGVYTGCIGYFSYNDTMDFNIAIRTIEYKNGRVSFGSGGAIIIDSDPEAEFQEILTKAYAMIKAINLAEHGRFENHELVREMSEVEDYEMVTRNN